MCKVNRSSLFLDVHTRLSLCSVPGNYRAVQKSIFLASSMQEGVCSQQASHVSQRFRAEALKQLFTKQDALMWEPRVFNEVWILKGG